MEYFDVVDEITGEPTGEVVSRDDAHARGVCHRTAHVWVVRERDSRVEVLLQRRSEQKDSFPGLFDTSSAGHIPAGDEPEASAVRELAEELGIVAAPSDLEYAGTFRIRYEEVFHGRTFRDNEVVHVYVLPTDVDTSTLTLQESEVSEARWFDLDEVWDAVRAGRGPFCVPIGGLEALKRHLSNTAS